MSTELFPYTKILIILVDMTSASSRFFFNTAAFKKLDAYN
jgi:hypothetical protein